MSTNEQLCLNLLRADTEEEVIAILKAAGFWDKSECWRLFGDRENNFSTIGNQQSRPEAALTEKVVNAIDARLMCECMVRGVDPVSGKAPETIKDAVAQLISGMSVGAYAGGSVHDWTDVKRREESKKITLAVSGSKKRPCITITDLGEGQSPAKMPQTFLSIDKSNKLRIPFVQGKFNMGGTGALQFCGRQNLQLIISRRNQAVAKAMGEHDDSIEKWGFTIVRRETAKDGAKNSVYTYLAPIGADRTPRQGEVIRFDADKLPLMPDGNTAYVREISSGSSLKLYEYDMKGFSSHALMRDGLLSRLEAMLLEPALPIRVYECRDYRGHAGSFETTLVGLSVRLDDNREGNIEEGFPDSDPLMIAGESMTARIYAFRADRAKTYRTNEGVIFTINGQTHAAIPKTIFSRNSVKMSRLAESLLVTIDCSDISVRAREDLFMNSRDRLRNTEIRKALEDELENALKNHEGLKELREKRYHEEMEERLAQSRPLEEVLKNLLKASPSLMNLFRLGTRIPNPFKTDSSQGGTGEKEETGKGDKPFVGKLHPTFFQFAKTKYGEILHRDFEIGRRCRINFQTDVVNDYFKRTESPGRFHVEILEPTGIDEPNYVLTPHNGIASLSIVMPEEFSVGDKITMEFTVEDDTLVEPFVNVATLTAIPQSDHSGGGERKQHGVGDGGEKLGPSGISMPEIHEVAKDEWEKYGFDRHTACDIVQEGNDTYTFRVNIDNVHLLTEIKAGAEDPRLSKSKFVFGNVLVGLALIQYFKEQEKVREEHGANGNSEEQQGLPLDIPVTTFTREMSRALAPFMLPMINRLGALSEDEVGTLGTTGDDE